MTSTTVQAGRRRSTPEYPIRAVRRGRARAWSSMVIAGLVLVAGGVFATSASAADPPGTEPKPNGPRWTSSLQGHLQHCGPGGWLDVNGFSFATTGVNAQPCFATFADGRVEPVTTIMDRTGDLPGTIDVKITTWIQRVPAVNPAPGWAPSGPRIGSHDCTVTGMVAGTMGYCVGSPVTLAPGYWRVFTIAQITFDSRSAPSRYSPRQFYSATLTRAAPKPDPTTKKPDPTTKKPDPTTKKPDPTTKKPDPTTKKPDPTTSTRPPTSSTTTAPGSTTTAPTSTSTSTTAPLSPVAPTGTGTADGTGWVVGRRPFPVGQCSYWAALAWQGDSRSGAGVFFATCLTTWMDGRVQPSLVVWNTSTVDGVAVDASVRLNDAGADPPSCGRIDLASGPKGYAYCLGGPRQVDQDFGYALGSVTLPGLSATPVRWGMYSGAVNGYGQAPPPTWTPVDLLASPRPTALTPVTTAPTGSPDDGEGGPAGTGDPASPSPSPTAPAVQLPSRVPFQV